MAHKNVVHQRNPFAIERRPTMLKDFLNENSNSCSSSGFKSFPRQQPINQATNSSSNSNNPNITSKLLPRSRSKAASITISSALHTLMKAVKNIPFTAVKSPSFLPRSLSWGSKKPSSRKESQNQVQIIVRVKDIMRWTSFREPQPLDFASSLHHCTTATTIIGSTSTTCSSSSNESSSSWCDSDFTSEFLQSDECGENEVEVGKKYLPCVGKDYSMEATTDTASYTALGPQVEVLLCDEAEQHSPVSVLDFQFGEDDKEAFSSTNFDQSIANVEKTKEMLMQKIKHFESLDSVNLDSWMLLEERTNFEEQEEEEVHGIEERAMELLNYIKATSSTPESCEANMEDKLLLDFFKEEMSAQRNQTDSIGFNWEMVSKAKAWMSGEHNTFEWGLEHKKEAYVTDMHKGGRWINKFEDDQEELALEIETAMSEYLVDELLVDLLLR